MSMTSETVSEWLVNHVWHFYKLPENCDSFKMSDNRLLQLLVHVVGLEQVIRTFWLDYYVLGQKLLKFSMIETVID